MAGTGVNPYAVLGLPEDCSQDELKRAYRELAHLYHPDHNSGADWATERWKLVNEAYEAITKPRPGRSQCDGATPVAPARTPRGAIIATALVSALIATGSGFILGKATGADVGAARAVGTAEARHDASVATRQAFRASFARSRRTAYRTAFRAAVKDASVGVAAQ